MKKGSRCAFEITSNGQWDGYISLNRFIRFARNISNNELCVKPSEKLALLLTN